MIFSDGMVIEDYSAVWMTSTGESWCKTGSHVGTCGPDLCPTQCQSSVLLVEIHQENDFRSCTHGPGPQFHGSWLRPFYFNLQAWQPVNKEIPTPTSINFSSVVGAYNDVRSDVTPTQWAVFKYDDHTILHSASGESFELFKEQFGDGERCYGYIRIQTGDEMSKRTKFVLVTWVGPDVGVMDRAKITNDKSIVKQVITNYAIEFQLEAASELDEELFRSELLKIGGTCYGTGIRKDIAAL